MVQPVPLNFIQLETKEVDTQDEKQNNYLSVEMITIFTVPKPFSGLLEITQFNAIQSWMRLEPPPEILLLGNEDGVGEFASKYGLKHLPDVQCNEYGTPLVSSIFAIARENASNRIMAYINADILLASDLYHVVNMCVRRFTRFLIIGRRWDVDVKKKIDFDTSGWREKIIEFAKTHGRLHPETGMDYFIFSVNAFIEIPPFAIGRLAWDNWVVWKGRYDGMAVVDATLVITAIHQNHPSMLEDRKEEREIEIRTNRQIAGERLFDVLDCNYVADDKRIKPARDKIYVERRMGRMRVNHPVLWRLLYSWKLRYLYCWLRLHL